MLKKIFLLPPIILNHYNRQYAMIYSVVLHYFELVFKVIQFQVHRLLADALLLN